MDFSSIKTTGRGKYGIPFCVIPQFQSWLGVHPDHVGFLIGFNGQTVKKIAFDCKCYIKIQDPNNFSRGLPWFIIKSSTQENVCEAYQRLRTIANEAEKRMPRFKNWVEKNVIERERVLNAKIQESKLLNKLAAVRSFEAGVFKPRPKAILDVKELIPQPHENVDEQKIVEVVRKNDNDGNEVLVDEKTNEVYSSDGSLVGHWVGGVIMDRSDASV